MNLVVIFLSQSSSSAWVHRNLPSRYKIKIIQVEQEIESNWRIK